MIAGRGGKQPFGLPNQLMQGILALLQREIRSSLHHCWANALADVREAALEGVADNARVELSPG